MGMSVDGRLLAERWSAPADGVDPDALRHQYDEVAGRYDADGWMVGRVTMQELAHGTAAPPGAPLSGLRATHIGERKGRQVAVALDPQGKLHYGQDHAAGDHVIAVLGEHVSDAYLGELQRDGVSYLFAGPDGRDLSKALGTLTHEFGITTLILQGGGRINGAFLKAGLIDEISILVYPGIDGLAGVSSIFEFAGAPGERPAAEMSLRLIGSETLTGGTVWLRYQVETAPSDLRRSRLDNTAVEPPDCAT